MNLFYVDTSASFTTTIDYSVTAPIICQQQSKCYSVVIIDPFLVSVTDGLTTSETKLISSTHEMGKITSTQMISVNDGLKTEQTTPISTVTSGTVIHCATDNQLSH